MYDRNLAIELMKIGDFSNARPMLERLIKDEDSNWSAYYMLGQCCRYLDDMKSAIKYLKKAARLNSTDPSIFLALGIAHQISKKWVEAINSFRIALELDKDYVLAYNSLALTQKQMGQLELALHNYDSGITALTRCIVKAISNSESNEILNHLNTPTNLWVDSAMFGGLYLCSLSNVIDSISWPTGEQAIEEERTKEHKGLYWVDTKTSDDKNTRLFLPNYFNTFREKLRADRIYSDLIGNKGTVLQMSDKNEEAEIHFKEAEYFCKNAP
jgi:tetratricopeptide (TPR) repeat protein